MKILLGILIGGAIGFIIGYFGKCASGACPLDAFSDRTRCLALRKQNREPEEPNPKNVKG